MLEGSLLF